MSEQSEGDIANEQISAFRTPGYYIVHVPSDGSKPLISPTPIYVAWRFVTTSFALAAVLDAAQAFISGAAYYLFSVFFGIFVRWVKHKYHPSEVSTELLASGVGWAGDIGALLTFVWFILKGVILRTIDLFKEIKMKLRR